MCIFNREYSPPRPFHRSANMGKVPRDGRVKTLLEFSDPFLQHTQCCVISYGWLFDLLAFHRYDSPLLLIVFIQFSLVTFLTVQALIVSTPATCIYLVLTFLWTLQLQLFTVLPLSFFSVNSTCRFPFLALSSPVCFLVVVMVLHFTQHFYVVWYKRIDFLHFCF